MTRRIYPETCPRPTRRIQTLHRRRLVQGQTITGSLPHRAPTTALRSMEPALMALPAGPHIGVLSGAHSHSDAYPRPGTPMSCQPTPEAPSAGVRSRRSLADQLPDGPSSSTQECQPDAHITLDELTTWFKDVKLLQTGPNAAAPTVFKSSQAIRQGIEVFGHLLGMKGTNARAQGESSTTGNPPLQTRCLLWIPHAGSIAPPCLLPASDDLE